MVDSSVWPLEKTLALHLVAVEFAFINFTFRTDSSALAMDHSIFKVALINRIIREHFEAHTIWLVIGIHLSSELSSTLTRSEFFLHSPILLWFLFIHVFVGEVVVRTHTFVNLFNSFITHILYNVVVVTDTEAMIDLLNQALHFVIQF